MFLQNTTNYLKYLKGVVFIHLSELVDLPEQKPNEYVMLNSFDKETIRKLRELNSVDLMELTKLLTNNANFVLKLMQVTPIEDSLKEVNECIDEVLVNKNLAWFLSNGSSVVLINNLFTIKDINALEVKNRQGRPSEISPEAEKAIKGLLEKYRFFDRQPTTPHGKIRTQAFFMGAVEMFGCKYSVRQIENLLDEALLETD